MVHTLNMLVLPLLPVIILLAQNIDTITIIRSSETSIADVRSQVRFVIRLDDSPQFHPIKTLVIMQ